MGFVDLQIEWDSELCNADSSFMGPMKDDVRSVGSLNNIWGDGRCRSGGDIREVIAA